MEKGRGAPRPISGPEARAAQAGRAAVRAGQAPARYSRTLARLKPEGRAATRGAAEARVYQAASPAVVLIVTKTALGSGVIVSADGKIVTNLHVVGDNPNVGVVFKPLVEGAEVGDADVHRAKVLRRDEVADLALLQVSEMPAHVHPLAIGSAAAVEVGSDVHAIGHPTGETWTYTKGIVSQIRRDYQWRAEDKIPHEALVIQTQTPINPGNSGGPLIDDKLQVVGINSFKGDGEGLNFAVSGDDVKAFLARNGDRKAATTSGKDAEAAAADCKIKALETHPSKDPKGVEVLVDSDCDGEGDALIVFPDDKRKPWMTEIDTDNDGKIDTVLFDDDHDGHPEDALYDTDGDGKPDLQGFYRRGEDEPYRWQKTTG